MKKNLMMTASMLLAFPIAFDNKNGWKVDADGNLEKDDKGDPIYIAGDGKEQSVAGDTISRLNGEAKTHREAKEAAEAKLEKYKDLDPVKAAEAIETLKNIDQKKLIDAGEVEKVREEISKGFTAQMVEKDKAIESLTGNLNGMTLQTAFGSSDFVKNKIGVPAEMFQATFAKNFKVENGKVVPYDQTGNKVYSKKNMGEVAGVDEALEIMVDAYPYKDSILKADDQSGSGNEGGGGGRGSGRTIKLADFNKLSPAQQSETAALAGKGEVNIVD